MDLSPLILNAVKVARASLGDLVVQYKIRRQTGFKYYNGRKEPMTTDVTVDGTPDRFEPHEIDGTLVKTTDNRVMLFIDTPDQVPTTIDTFVDVDGQEYQIRSVVPTFAGQKAVVAMVQTRK